MDLQATSLIAILKNPNVSTDQKNDYLVKFKTFIKHHQVPLDAMASSFEAIRIAISHPQQAEGGFSTLSHLLKRLQLQNNQSIIVSLAPKTFPVLLERLSESKDRMQIRSINAFAELWNSSPTEVEEVMRDKALTAKKSSRQKQGAMMWVVKMHKDSGLQFRSFVPHIVDCLEDADGVTRDVAKTSIIDLFRNASDRAKSDLSKQLDKRGVRKAIVEYLHAQLDSASSLPNSRPSSQPTPDPASQTNPFSIASFSQDTEEARAKTFGGRLSSKTPLTSSLASRGNDVSSFATAKIENDLKPITVDSTGWLHLDKSLTPDAESKSCKLEDIARDFLPNFEGKETEHNWTAREKNILALRRITKGNAPTQFTSAYLGMIKALLDGILKNVNSLRTTVSANGCLLVQEIAQAVGPGMDAMVEILLQNLVRLCGHTKKINAANGNTTISIIISHTTFHVRLLQHIWGACQDKNVQPRCFAALWLKIIISKYRHHKSTLEHGNGVEIMEKCLLKGLTDAQADVRQNMRDAYWSFQPLWPTRAETVLQSLKPAGQDQLLAHPSNPNKDSAPLASEYGDGPRPPLSRSTTTVKPSLKELLAQKREAAKLARPTSAASTVSPVRPTITRPATSMAHERGTLSSAPIRPVRPKSAPKKAEGPSTPTSATSPSKPKAKKLVIAEPHILKDSREPTTAKRLVMGLPKTPRVFKDPAPVFVLATRSAEQLDEASEVFEAPSPTKAAEDFTLVIPSSNAIEYNSLPPRNQSMIHEDNIPDSTRSTMNDQNVDDLSASMTLGNKSLKFERPSPAFVPKLLNLQEPLAAGDLSSTSSGSLQLPAETDSDITPRASVLNITPPVSRSPSPPTRHGSTNNSKAHSGHVIRPTSMSPLRDLQNEPHPISVQKTRASTNSPESMRPSLGVLAELPLNGSTPQKVDTDAQAGRLIQSGILRIRANTLDAHGFRRLQGVISSKGDILESHLDALLPALITNLDALPEDRTLAQTIITIRMLVQTKKEMVDPFMPQLLVSMIGARAHYDSNTHLAGSLDMAISTLIVNSSNAENCLHSILRIIDTEKNSRLFIASLNCMAELLYHHDASLSPSLEKTMGEVAQRGMKAEDATVRKSSIEFALRLHACVGENAFWGLLPAIGTADRTLLMYYLAREKVTTNA